MKYILFLLFLVRCWFSVGLWIYSWLYSSPQIIDYVNKHLYFPQNYVILGSGESIFNSRSSSLSLPICCNFCFCCEPNMCWQVPEQLAVLLLDLADPIVENAWPTMSMSIMWGPWAPVHKCWQLIEDSQFLGLSQKMSF